MALARATAGLARQAIVVVAITGAAMLLAFLVWSFGDVFLLAFASVLVALLLRGLVGFVREQLALSDGRALALVLVGLLIVASLSIVSTIAGRNSSIPALEVVSQVFHRLGTTLSWWIIGRIGLMGLNAAVTGVGLWLLGIPLALTLGILSGLLNFIPNVGPLLAAAPAILIALVQGPTQALYVALLCVAYQSADGYLLTPIVTQRTVSVPPAVTLLAQVLLGASAGLYGLLLASPLVAAGMLVIRMLYVEDVLGDDLDDPATGEARADPS